MHYYSFTALIFTFLFSFGFSYCIINISNRFKSFQPVREEIVAGKPIPTLGGLAMLSAINLGIGLFNLQIDFSIILLANAYGILGLIDDLLKLKNRRHTGLKIRYRLGLEIFFAIIFVFYCFQIDPARFYTPILNFFPILWGTFVIVASANAFNLTDGMDSLAAGLAILCFLFFNCFINSDLSPVVCAALLGFLFWNRPNAKLYMGDVGSLAIGSIIGAFAYKNHMELWLTWVGLIFIIETLSVIIQVVSFKYRKKRVFLMSPLHHHFEKKGYPKVKIILAFHIVGLFLTISGILLKGKICN